MTPIDPSLLRARLEELIEKWRADPADEASPPQGWQPIDTAPKNCTDILLFLPANDAGGAEIVIGVWTPTAWLTGECQLMLDAPTHWMPLPDPPTGAP